jgi:hypothetical protein
MRCSASCEAVNTLRLSFSVSFWLWTRFHFSGFVLLWRLFVTVILHSRNSTTCSEDLENLCNERYIGSNEELNEKTICGFLLVFFRIWNIFLCYRERNCTSVFLNAATVLCLCPLLTCQFRVFWTILVPLALVWACLSTEEHRYSLLRIEDCAVCNIVSDGM